MRSNALSNFARWSGRSEEMRIMAEEMQDPTARAMMLRLSADYGRLAERAEEVAALGQPRTGPNLGQWVREQQKPLNGAD